MQVHIYTCVPSFNFAFFSPPVVIKCKARIIALDGLITHSVNIYLGLSDCFQRAVTEVLSASF